MNASTPLLAIDGLRGGHGEIDIVHGFSAAVAPGELAFVTGRNEVGKSTLVKLVAGHLPVRAGQLTFRGEDLTSAPGHRRLHLGLGYAPQEGIVFDELTVAENLTLQYANRSLDRYEALFARFPLLAERLAQPAGTLSGGEKKILSFCRALGEDIRLVILDEPTEGVQAENIARMAAAIREAASGGPPSSSSSRTSTSSRKWRIGSTCSTGAHACSTPRTVRTFVPPSWTGSGSDPDFRI